MVKAKCHSAVDDAHASVPGCAMSCSGNGSRNGSACYWNVQYAANALGVRAQAAFHGGTLPDVTQRTHWFSSDADRYTQRFADLTHDSPSMCPYASFDMV